MNKAFYMRVLSWIALPVRLYLGGVFLFACYHKIMDPYHFAIDVATYQFLPLYLINIMAIVMPWVELAAGLMLVLGIRTRAAGLMCSVMMIMFIIALMWALHLELDMSCGCFASSGTETDPISLKTIGRDSVWLVMSLYIFIFDTDSIGVEWLWRKTKEKRDVS